MVHTASKREKAADAKAVNPTDAKEVGHRVDRRRIIFTNKLILLNFSELLMSSRSARAHRNATTPSERPPQGWNDIIVHTYKAISEDRVCGGMGSLSCAGTLYRKPDLRAVSRAA